MPNAHIANKSLQLGGGECRKKDRMREKITLKVFIIKKMFPPPPSYILILTGSTVSNYNIC